MWGYFAGENETEVVPKKKKDAKEVNIATDILKKLTAIGKISTIRFTAVVFLF